MLSILVNKCASILQLLCRCVVERGEDNPRCAFYEGAYKAMCPADWVRASLSFQQRPYVAVAGYPFWEGLGGKYMLCK